MRQQPRSSGGWLPMIVVIAGLLVLDFSPTMTVMDQEALGGFVTSVGVELFRQYTDKTVQSGVYSPAEREPAVRDAAHLLAVASNLTGSPVDAGRAALRLGEIQSRFLNNWEVALGYFKKAEVLLPHKVEPKYQLARAYIELAQYELAGDKLREAISYGAANPETTADEAQFHSCLGPVELARLVFGPANRNQIVESAKRLVQLKEVDNELVSRGLKRAETACPASMYPTIELYLPFLKWCNYPKGNSGPPKRGPTKKPTDLATRRSLQAFIDFIDSSEVKKLTGQLQGQQSDTIVKVGMTSMLDTYEGGHGGRAGANGQPLKAASIVNPLIYEKAVGSHDNATPLAQDDDDGLLVPQPQDADAHQWHTGYKRLSVHEGLFSRIDAIRGSLELDCTKLQHVLSSYLSFIDSHQAKVTALLQPTHKQLLITWKARNHELRSLCVQD